MDIAMLIVSILSLIATIAVALVIFFLQIRIERNSRKRAEQIEENIRKRELENQAKLFILDNSDEIEYLTLAQLATVKQSARKIYSDGSGRYRHKRKLYNVFHRCEKDLQKEIIRQANFIDYKFEQFDIEILISYMLDLFKNDAKKLGIMETDFLYEGAKYFHKGLNSYGEKKTSEKANFENSIWIHLLDFVDYQKAEDKEEMYNKLQNSVANQFAQLINKEQIYSRPDTFAEFEKIHKIAPFNHYWHGIAQHASEELCTYVIMEMIRQGAILINRENDKDWIISPEYALPETYEDLYYATVLTLYCVYYDQVKDLEELKVKNEEA